MSRVMKTQSNSCISGNVWNTKQFDSNHVLNIEITQSHIFYMKASGLHESWHLSESRQTLWWRQLFRKSLTYCHGDKMAAILQMTFSNAFSWMIMFSFWFIFYYNLCIRIQFSTSIGWSDGLALCGARSHYLNQWWSKFYDIMWCD